MKNLNKALFRIDPTEGLLQYVENVKPYHSKVLDVFVEYIYSESLRVNVKDKNAMDVKLATVDRPIMYANGYGQIWSPYNMLSLDQVPKADIISATGIDNVNNNDSNTFVVSMPVPPRYDVIASNIQSNQLTFVETFNVISVNRLTRSILVTTPLSATNFFVGHVAYVGADSTIVGTYTIHHVIVNSADQGIIEIFVNEPISSATISNVSIKLNESTIPYWPAGTALTLTPSLSEHSSVNLYFNPTPTLGVFNLSYVRYPQEFKDILDIEVNTHMIHKISRSEPFNPGDTITIKGTPANINDNQYTISYIIKDGTNFKITVMQPVVASIPSSSASNGNITYSGSYGDPYNIVTSAPDLFTSTNIHERFSFVLEGLISPPSNTNYTAWGIDQNNNSPFISKINFTSSQVISEDLIPYPDAIPTNRDSLYILGQNQTYIYLIRISYNTVYHGGFPVQPVYVTELYKIHKDTNIVTQLNWPQGYYFNIRYNQQSWFIDNNYLYCTTLTQGTTLAHVLCKIDLNTGNLVNHLTLNHPTLDYHSYIRNLNDSTMISYHSNAQDIIIFNKNTMTKVENSWNINPLNTYFPVDNTNIIDNLNMYFAINTSIRKVDIVTGNIITSSNLSPYNTLRFTVDALNVWVYVSDTLTVYKLNKNTLTIEASFVLPSIPLYNSTQYNVRFFGSNNDTLVIFPNGAPVCILIKKSTFTVHIIPYATLDGINIEHANIISSPISVDGKYLFTPPFKDQNAAALHVDSVSSVVNMSTNNITTTASIPNPSALTQFNSINDMIGLNYRLWTVTLSDNNGTIVVVKTTTTGSSIL